MDSCPLCQPDTDETIWADASCRVLLVDDEDHPGYCRVIWHAHVAEMSDLTPADQRHLMNVVMATEIALRELMQPAKINLASLGNKVPHLHWHVIARFVDDRHFPDAIWGKLQREGVRRNGPARAALHDALVVALTELRAG